jgi:5-methylcytosine-specific restriction endonuclease McrA
MADSRGRSTRRWRKLKQDVYMRGASCCRCGQPIDYNLPYLNTDGEPNGESKSVDHFPMPLSTHPHLAEDLSNLAAAHLRCNISAGNRGVGVELGTTSRKW